MTTENKAVQIFKLSHLLPCEKLKKLAWPYLAFCKSNNFCSVLQRKVDFKWFLTVTHQKIPNFSSGKMKEL